MAEEFKFNIEIVKACPVCDSVDIVFYFKTQYKGLDLKYWKCNNCTVKFLVERMTDKSQREYYSKAYSKVTNHANENDQNIQIMRARHFSGILKSLGVTPARHLDVGSSVGILMEEFTREFGCESYGVEWCDENRRIAQEKGLKVTNDYPDNKFDIITLSHVLEHMNNPVTNLLQLGAFLIDNGYIMIEVPNSEANMHAYLLHHPIAYNQRSLDVLFERAGFDLVYVSLHSVPFDSPLDLHITMVLR